MRKVFLLIFIPFLINSQSLHRDFIADQKNDIKLNPEKSLLAPETALTKKKTGLAIIYSLLLPGMGELYAGSFESGKYFTIAEGVFWGALIGFNVYGQWEENNYKEYAKAIGGANIEGKDDKYFADLGNYLDIYQYNRNRELNRRFDEVYNEETHYWMWRGQAQRREYRNMWLASETAYNNIRFAVGALILNRIASAVNAVRLVVKHNRKVKEEKIGWNIYFGVEPITHQHTNFTVNFLKAF